MTEALMAWCEPQYPPANPLEAAIATRDRPQPASAPSELVMPPTASAASSAARARSISCSALGSTGSIMSRLGQPGAISEGSASPQNGSSGTARAIATVRSTSSASIFGERSLDDTIACCLPTSTRSPRSWPSERSSFSVLPRRRACDSEVPSTSTASAASAPAFSALPMTSCSRSMSFAVSLSNFWSAIAHPKKTCLSTDAPRSVGITLFPDRLARAGEAIFGPFARHLGDDLFGHADRPPPFAMRFGRQFVRRVEADLAAEPGFRRGEIKIIDRRVLHQRHVAHRVHAGRDRPHDILPVAHGNVVINNDDKFCVHELPQKRPDPHHHPLGVAGIALAYRDDRDPVGAALGRQPEIDDFRKLLLQ